MTIAPCNCQCCRKNNSPFTIGMLFDGSAQKKDIERLTAEIESMKAVVDAATVLRDSYYGYDNADTDYRKAMKNTVDAVTAHLAKASQYKEKN